MNRARMDRPHRYALFGLQIDSDLPLPELFDGAPDVPADVTITLGPLPVGDFGTGTRDVAGGALLVIEGGARYFVADGSRIIVDPNGAPERNVRLFLLGSAFGLLIHQRRLLPLHANAVEIDGRAVAFMGPSGTGKSTLAAWFSGRGFPLLADDVTVVDWTGERPMVLPGLARLRLHPAVIAATGRNPSDFAPSFEGDPSFDKRDVLLRASSLASGPRALAAVVELTRSAPAFEPLHGAAAAEAIMSHTYRGAFTRILNTTHEHWATSMRVAQTVPIYRASVDFDLNRLDESYEPLVDRVRAAVRRVAAHRTRVPDS